MLTDTCPACNAIVELAADGKWHWCSSCHEGRLRWVPDDLAGQLRAELVEVEGWLAEGIPGAAELVAAIRDRLERLAREAR